MKFTCSHFTAAAAVSISTALGGTTSLHWSGIRINIPCLALKTLCIWRYSCVSNVSKPLYELPLQDILTLWFSPQAGWGQGHNGKARKIQEGRELRGLGGRMEKFSKKAASQNPHQVRASGKLSFLRVLKPLSTRVTVVPWGCGGERVVRNSGLVGAQGNVIAWDTHFRFSSRAKQ